SQTIIHEESEKLTALQASRTAALENYMGTIREDLSSLSHNEYVRQALLDYTKAWNELGFSGNQTALLQKLYIEENPNPAGSKDVLDFAPDGSTYSQVHG